MIQIPRLRGVIKRRLLVNFRADAETVARLLPAPFQPQTHDGHALVGVCLIRLEAIRPAISPFKWGFNSENAAHRIAVEWEQEGQTKSGVYIPRRDSGALLTLIAGGRLFPGEHFGAHFRVDENGDSIRFQMRAFDASVEVKLRGQVSSNWPRDSIFQSLDEASKFYQGGATGFSPRRDGNLDGLQLKTANWRVEALDVDEAFSSYFSDETRFPQGSVTFDHVLLMRDIEHQWLPAQL